VSVIAGLDFPLECETGTWKWNMELHGIGAWDLTALTKLLMGFSKGG